MSTKFEKYLKEKRHILDVEYPDDEAIWKRIEENRPEQKSRKVGKSIRINSNLRRIAASVIIVIALSYIAIDLSIGISFNNNSSLALINSQYGEIEKNYLQEVKYRKEEINKVSVPDNDIIRSITDELKQLDKLFSETQKDLIELGDNERAVNTIFNMYERKIELLERIIVETDKYDNYEKNNKSEI
jgi:hypothetical protein